MTSADRRWPVRDRTGEPAGYATSAGWSPDFESNVAIGMVSKPYWDPGTELMVETPAGEQTARVCATAWI